MLNAELLKNTVSGYLFERMCFLGASSHRVNGFIGGLFSGQKYVIKCSASKKEMG